MKIRAIRMVYEHYCFIIPIKDYSEYRMFHSSNERTDDLGLYIRINDKVSITTKDKYIGFRN